MTKNTACSATPSSIQGLASARVTMPPEQSGRRLGEVTDRPHALGEQDVAGPAEGSRDERPAPGS